MEDTRVILKHGKGSKTVTSEWSSNVIHKSSVQEVKKGNHAIWQDCKANTTNETEDIKEMVMKNQNGGYLSQENIEST